tara:strand:- start:120 stop:323 length:204 start_codon:yes stop_codon:yes gene_type:complete
MVNNMDEEENECECKDLRWDIGVAFENALYNNPDVSAVDCWWRVCMECGLIHDISVENPLLCEDDYR